MQPAIDWGPSEANRDLIAVISPRHARPRGLNICALSQMVVVVTTAQSSRTMTLLTDALQFGPGKYTVLQRLGSATEFAVELESPSLLPLRPCLLPLDLRRLAPNRVVADL